MYRPQAVGMHAMVTSGNSLASLVGVRTLLAGGHAVDAAITTNAVLQVTSPFVCGLGGDLFALIYEARTGVVYGFNGSGRSPAELTIERVRAAGHESMPRRGPLTVTVPGCVDAWSQIHKRFGHTRWVDLFSEAIAYARDGHPVSRDLARSTRNARNTYATYRSWLDTFVPGGVEPREGTVLRQPELNRSLELVAAGGRDALYTGELAAKIVAAVREEGGVLGLDDLAAHHGEWAGPISTTYRGHTVYTNAPNSQGVATLIALNLLDDVDLMAAGFDSATRLCYLIEATKLAYADRNRHITDPAFSEVPVDWLLDKQRLRGALLQGRSAGRSALALDGETTSFSVVDEEGNAVACIQSNYGGFGSGLAAGGFGLQNRGAGFTLDPSHVNRLEPGKRALHTIMNTMVMRGGAPWILFGAVGGDTQPQTNVQILTNVMDFGMNIQQAIEAPRLFVGGPYEYDDSLHAESRFSAATLQAMASRGYDLQVAPDMPDRPGFGGASFAYGQGLVIDPDSGVRFGGADPRWDGYAVGY